MASVNFVAVGFNGQGVNRKERQGRKVNAEELSERMEWSSGYNSALRSLRSCPRFFASFASLCGSALLTAMAAVENPQGEQNQTPSGAPSMRVLIVTFALLCALVAGAVAQQANSSTDEAKKKKEDEDHRTRSQESGEETGRESPGSQPGRRAEAGGSQTGRRQGQRRI